MKGIIFAAGILIGWLYAVSQREEVEAPKETIPLDRQSHSGPIGPKGPIGVCPGCGGGSGLKWDPEPDKNCCYECGWEG